MCAVLRSVACSERMIHNREADKCWHLAKARWLMVEVGGTIPNRPDSTQNRGCHQMKHFTIALQVYKDPFTRTLMRATLSSSTNDLLILKIWHTGSF